MPAEKNPHAFQGATNNAQISGVQCKIYGAQVETTAIFALTVQEIMEQEAFKFSTVKVAVRTTFGWTNNAEG